MPDIFNIKENLLLKYLVFGSLYFSEGIMIALTTVILPVYLVEKGISLPVIGLVVGITSLPWVIKFVFGGIADKFRTIGRKPFILLGGILGALSAVALAFIDPVLAIIPFSLFLFLMRCGIVFLDVSSDGMAIEVTKPRERGKVNGAMFAGQFFGMAFGAFILPLLAHNLGYFWAFIATGIVISAVILLPLLINEEVNREKSVITQALLIELKRKVIIMLMIFLPLTTLSIGFLETIMPPYMKLSVSLDIGYIGIIALYYSLAMAAGSIVGGFASDRYGRKSTLFTVLSIAALSSFLLVITKNFYSTAAIWAIVGFTQGGISSIGCAILMDFVNPKIGATEFSIMTSFFNLGSTVGATFSGFIVVLLGFHYSFIISALVYIPSIILLNFIQLKKPEASEAKPVPKGGVKLK